MGGVTSRFNTRVPTSEELEECQWFHLTGDQEWEPYSSSFVDNEHIMDEREEGCEQQEREIYETSSSRSSIVDEYLDSVVARNLSSISSALTTEGLYQELKDNVQITSEKALRIIAAMQTGTKKAEISKEQLASLWNIPLKAAAQTISVTTQRGIRMAIKPLQAGYSAKQAHMRYDQLGGRHGRFYSDTMFASVKSLQNNKMGQIFVNDVNFTRFISMQTKGQAGDALLDVILDIGIPVNILSIAGMI